MFFTVLYASVVKTEEVPELNYVDELKKMVSWHIKGLKKLNLYFV